MTSTTSLSYKQNGSAGGHLQSDRLLKRYGKSHHNKALSVSLLQNMQTVHGSPIGVKQPLKLSFNFKEQASVHDQKLLSIPVTVPLHALSTLGMGDMMGDMGLP